MITHTPFTDDFGPKVRLHFEYAADIVEAIKTITGRWYDPETKSWSIPRSRLPELEDLVGVIPEGEPARPATPRRAGDTFQRPSQAKPVQRTDRMLDILEDIAGSLRTLAVNSTETTGAVLNGRTESQPPF